MEKEEIRRGLECCANHNCSNCPVDKLGFLGGDMTCIHKLCINTLALLKEQEEIINRYQWEDGEPK